MKQLILLLSAIPLLAANYYVSPSGNNSNAGTSAGAAWQTAKYAGLNSGCGDVINVMGGSYPNDAIYATALCTSGNVQIWQAYSNQVPIITGVNTSVNVSAYVTGNFITLNGIHFENNPGVSVYVSGIHDTFLNCVFVNVGDNAVTALEASYLTFTNNYFDTVGSPLNGCPNSCGEGGVTFTGCDHVLVANNYFARIGHAASDFDPAVNTPGTSILFPTFAVHFQNNTIEQHWGGGVYFGSGPDANAVVENNVIAYAGEFVNFEKVATEIYAAGVIFRNNLIVNTSKGDASGNAYGVADHAIELVSEAYKAITPSYAAQHDRIYNNTSYNIGAVGYYVYQQCDATPCLASTTLITANKAVNNIWFKCQQSCYYGYACGPSYWPQVNHYLLMGNAGTPWVNLVNSNYFYDNIVSTADPSGLHIPSPNLYLDVSNYPPGGANEMSLAAIQAAVPSFYFGNSEANPLMTDPDNGDYSLQSGSPAIGSGAHLSQTTAVGTATGSVPVADAYFFSSGDGVVAGDRIIVGSNAAVTVTTVNYSANTLTVSPAITYKSGDNVDQSYTGGAPDIGAIQHGTGISVNINPHISSWSLSGSTMTLTGVNFTPAGNTIEIIGGAVEANVAAAISGGTSISFTIPPTILPSGGPSLIVVNNANGVSNAASLFAVSGTSITGISSGGMVQ